MTTPYQYIMIKVKTFSNQNLPRQIDKILYLF